MVKCFDYRILCEYREVLQRPKFGFTSGEVNSLLDWIEHYGQSVVEEPLDDVFIDVSDKKFYEVAKFCGARFGRVAVVPDAAASPAGQSPKRSKIKFDSKVL